MQKVIHESWNAWAEDGPRLAPSAVMLDFSGSFLDGSYAGTLFAGRIHYPHGVAPTERHISFALYDEWPRPIVTMAVGGQILDAQGAAVYASIFDGTASHYDFVTMYGRGPFDRVEDAAFFELYFADDDASTLDGTVMPTAGQLGAMPIKQVSFGTNAPGNVMSVGQFTLRTAG